MQGVILIGEKRGVFIKSFPSTSANPLAIERIFEVGKEACSFKKRLEALGNKSLRIRNATTPNSI